MRKKLIVLIPIWLVLLTGLTLFTSCHKKYDDSEVRDLIKANQEAIQKTQASIDSLKQVISAGATIVKIVSFQDSTGGLAIYVNNQKEPYKLYNGVKGDKGATGAAGANATAWTISDDGFWVKDGEKTGYRAKGADGATGATGVTGDKGDKGDPGANGTDGTNGKYYIPQDDGYFYLHEDGKTPDEKTNLQWKQPWITAILNADGTLTIKGMSGATESVTFSPTTLISMKLDMTCIDEVQDGYPVAYVARHTNLNTQDLLTDDETYYSQAITYYIYPSNAAISAQNISLTIKNRNQETFDYDYQVTSLSTDPAKGTLTIYISSSNNLQMAERINMTYANPPLFALNYTDHNNHTVTSEYAVAMPINGSLYAFFLDNEPKGQSGVATWGQLWPGGPKFQSRPYLENYKYKWGVLKDGSTPAVIALQNTYLDKFGNLKPQYDTVTSFCGDGAWRMPTKKELEEFCNQYNNNYTVSGDYYVFRGTGKFDMNQLFLKKTDFGYWSSSADTQSGSYALDFLTMNNTFRLFGTNNSDTKRILPVLK